jgi:hypothetical protein
MLGEAANGQRTAQLHPDINPIRNEITLPPVHKVGSVTASASLPGPSCEPFARDSLRKRSKAVRRAGVPLENNEGNTFT